MICLSSYIHFYWPQTCHLLKGLHFNCLFSGTCPLRKVIQCTWENKWTRTGTMVKWMDNMDFFLQHMLRLVAVFLHSVYSKTFIKWPLSKRPKIGFQDQFSLNVGQKYCRMLQGEHSAILKAFIKLPFVIKIFVLSIFDWPFYTGFTVLVKFIYFQECMSITGL